MGTSTSESRKRRPVRPRPSASVLRARATTPVEANDRIVRTSGLELFVRERGEGFPLLMINGLGGNLEMWGPAETMLAARSRLIMFDGPGMGRSQTPVLPMPIPSIARAVCGLLDELGLDQVDVLGYSMGGVIAQQLAKDASTRVRRLALVATACGWGSVPGKLPALSVIAMPLRYYSRWLYENTNRLIGDSDTVGTGVVTEAQVQARMQYPPSLLGYSYLVCAGALWTSLPWLSSVDVPTLVVSGTADQLVPFANSVQLAGLLPAGRLHLVPDQGHLILFGPSPAHSLLADYFASETLEDSTAWASAKVVDEEEMRAVVSSSSGGQPVKVFSQAFRWLVDSLDPGRVSG